MKIRRRETLRLVGEFVLMVVMVLAVLELLVLGAARAAQAHAEEVNVATAQNVQPFPSSGASRHLPPEGKARGAATASPQGEAMDGASEADGQKAVSAAEARELEYAVVLLGNEYPDTGRNDLDELRGFDGVIQNCTVTYYCCEARAHICGGGSGKTATGTDVTAGRSAAVDPDVIPLGAEIFVDYGDGVLHSYIAEDTGSAIIGGHIDLAVATHEEALELGVRTATVWWTA